MIRLPLITASALHPCGMTHVLKRQTPPDERRLAIMKKGTDKHALLASFYNGEELPADLSRGDDKMINLTREKLAPLVPAENRFVEIAIGLSETGNYVKVHETAPGSHDYRTCEGEAEEAVTAGRLDLAWHDDELASVVDHKTGRTAYGPPEFVAQLMALGLSFGSMVGAKRIRMGINYAMSGTVIWSPEIALPAPEMITAVVAMAQVDDEAKPDIHCHDCWEAKNCEYSFINGDTAAWALS